MIDYGRKRRRDCNIEDDATRTKIRSRIIRRLIQEVFKAYQFRVTQSERYIVACYDTGEGGYFPGAPGQYDAGHRSSPFCRDDEPECRGV